MKLFQITYMQDSDTASYLTIGGPDDTEVTIRDRELAKMEDKGCLYIFYATEIKEVDGHEITVVA